MKSEIIYIFSLIFIILVACDRDKKQKSAPPSIEQQTDSLVDNQLDVEEENRSYEILLEEYETSERGTWQNPDLVLGKLGDLREKIVADIGSGTGYFTFPLAKTAAKVIAIDIEPAYLEYIEESKLDLSPEISSVIETRLTEADDPNLSESEADAILMVNVYYYLDDRPAYMARVHRGLRDDGVLVLVDFKVGEMPVGPAENKVPAEQAVMDLKKAGFEVIEVDLQSLQYQYIITAK